MLKQFILAGLACIALSACQDTNNIPPPSTVNVISSASTAVLAPGNSDVIPIVFTATGTVNHLNVTNLSALPHSWSVQGDGNTFTCATVPASGTDCQLNLIFAPTEPNQDNGTLALNYTYVNSAGQNRTGQISVPYAVLNTVMTSVNPTPSINTVIDSTQNVFITFSAFPSATTASDLQVTSDLADLPSGWSVIGGASSFNCQTVQGMNGCQLGLSFQPTAPNQQGTLSLNYSYQDNSDTLQQGTVAIPYSVMTHNTVQGTITPANISVAVGTSVPVTINYTTSDGLPATEFHITGGLNGLGDLGWSGPSSFNCDLVMGTNGCLLQLTFAPTDYNQDGTLQLDYRYKDDSGAWQKGNTSINYSATTIDTILTKSSPASPVNAYVDQAVPVTLTFTTSDEQTATNLRMIDGMKPLPDGWTQINGTPGAFNCSTVNTGTGCQLVLQFAPTAAITSGTLTLTYTYDDNSGNSKTDTTNLNYSATAENNIQFSASPGAPLTVAANNTQAVTVDFTTDGGSASNFQMDLSDLSTRNLDWSSTSGSSLACESVDTATGTCELTLTYAPTTKEASVLNLPYTYIANDGKEKTGTFSYQYSTGTDENTVNAASTPASANGTAVGTSITVTVNFNTSDDKTASKLSPDLSKLPAGWNASSFKCPMVPPSNGGTGCSLTVTYTPTARTGNTTLVLPYSYIANDGDGPLTGTLSIPYSAVVNYAYISNNITNGRIDTCAVNPITGNIASLSSCSLSTGTFSSATGIAFQTINGTTYAYIPASGTGKINQCILDPTSFNTSSCTQASGFTTPQHLAFQTTNGTNYAYIVNGSNVSQCAIDPVSGSMASFASCAQTTGFTSPRGIAFQTFGNITYAYVSASGTGKINQCQLNATSGALMNCTQASGFTSPQGIAFQTINGTTYAYIANGSNISQCAADSTSGNIASFSSCSQASGFNSPKGIAFQTINGTTYAYIANGSNVSQCAVDPSSGNIASFSSCTQTGGFSSAYGIAFQSF